MASVPHAYQRINHVETKIANATTQTTVLLPYNTSGTREGCRRRELGRSTLRSMAYRSVSVIVGVQTAPRWDCWLSPMPPRNIAGRSRRGRRQSGRLTGPAEAAG